MVKLAILSILTLTIALGCKVLHHVFHVAEEIDDVYHGYEENNKTREQIEDLKKVDIESEPQTIQD